MPAYVNRGDASTVPYRALTPYLGDAVFICDGDFIYDSRRALDAGELPGGIAGLVGAYLGDRGSSDDAVKGILYLNAACPLVQRLAAQQRADDAWEIILTIIYQTARLFAGRTLTPADVAAAYREIGDVLGRLLP